MNAQWFTLPFWQDLLREVALWAVATIPAVLLILVFALVVSALMRRLLRRVSTLVAANLKKTGRMDPTELDKRVATLTGIVSAATRLVLWLIVAMMVLRRFGIDVAPIIAGAGIIGLAVGFGAQELVRDFISGFFILLENQVRAGDVAVINGTGGLVESVGLRTVVLRDLAGTVHIVQNGKINTLSNMTKDWSAAVFDVGVAYREDTDRVVEIMKDVGAELRADVELGPDIIDEIEVFGVEAFAESSVVIKARLRTKPIRQWAIGREYRRRLKRAFDAHGIEIPFPYRSLVWAETGKTVADAEADAQGGAAGGD